MKGWIVFYFGTVPLPDRFSQCIVANITVCTDMLVAGFRSAGQKSTFDSLSQSR